MLVLFETPAGFALFKVLDEGKLEKSHDFVQEFETLEKAQKIVKLKQFSKFGDTTEALEATTALVENKVSKSLKKFLKKNIQKKGISDQLLVADAKLGGAIKDKLGIQCVASSAGMELMRGIREQLQNLLGAQESEKEMNAMTLGLSHSLSRYKLKFSPDKVDTMIVQAISLLDDLDKELNTYSMRVREWYGWSFPEMGKIVTDNVQYARVVRKLGLRVNVHTVDLTDVVEEDMAQDILDAAVTSMGTEISDFDIENIKFLCDQIISMAEYRTQLHTYLQSRMRAMAPNLSVLVGELVGARLISHAGSLVNLAKQPASTVQILGAEKALFRALKTKHDTPKYGLIYHASFVGQAAPKDKGKMARVLAAKCALATRVDALGDSTEATIGFDARAKLEAKMSELQYGSNHQLTSRGSGAAPQKPYIKDVTPKRYDPQADSTIGLPTPSAAATPKSEKKRKRDDDGEDEGIAFVKGETEGGDVEATPSKKSKKDKKKKKKDKDKDDSRYFSSTPPPVTPVATSMEVEGTPATEKKKKKKKKDKEALPDTPATEKKKKKKKSKE